VVEGPHVPLDAAFLVDGYVRMVWRSETVVLAFAFDFLA
jgi:hypothetical protein